MTEAAKMILLLIRCGFIGDRRALTRKGRGLLPRWAWTAYVHVRCGVDARFRACVVDTLKCAISMTPKVGLEVQP